MIVVPCAEMEQRDAVAIATILSVAADEMAERELWEFDSWILTPIQQNQAFFGFDGDFPVAFATWGFFSEQTVRKYLGECVLDFEDWCDGNSFWLVDCVAPFGHGFKFARALQKQYVPRNVQTNWWRTGADRLGKYQPRMTH